MPTQTIEIGGQTPIAAASALKKVGYDVTSGGKQVNVAETDDKGAIHTKKWDRCVKKVKAQGKSEEAAYKICSSSINNAGVKSGHQRKSGKGYVANRHESEVNEIETMLDVFPELNQCVPQDGGEVKDIKLGDKHVTKATKPKEVVPKKVPRDKQLEGIMSKTEIMEAIYAAEPGVAPSKPVPDTPTTTPSKPGQKPQRQNPFRPKPGPNPRPKGSLPDWLTSDKLGIGQNQPVNEEIVEIKALIKSLI